MKYFLYHYKKNYVPLVLVALFSIISYYMLFDNIITVKNTIVHANEEKANSVAQQMHLYLNTKIRFLKTIEETVSSMKSKGFNEEEIEGIIKDILKDYKDIKDIFISDENGIIKSCIDNEKSKKDEKYTGVDISFREYFKTARYGKEAITTVLNDVVTKEEIVLIVAPYYNDKNVFEGVIGISINREALSHLVNAYNIDEKEYVTIVDEQGKILEHPRLQAARMVAQNTAFLDGIIKRMKTGRKGTVEIKSILDNEVKLFSYMKIEGSPWGVICVKHISKVYMPVFKQFILNFNMLIAIGLLIYLILKNYFLQIKREEDFLMYSMERMEAFEQISVGIAHEIRNPLSTIKGYLQMEHVKNPSDLSTLALHDLSRIEKTLNQFLKLAKPLEEEEGEFYPHEVIDEITTIIEAIGILKDITIEYDIDKSMKKINFPKDYLRFVILNLIQNDMNAIKGKGIIQINLKKLNEKKLVYSIEILGDIQTEKKNDKNNPCEAIQMTYKIIEANGGKVKILKSKKMERSIHIIIPFE